jgi:hypothetical protein
MLLVRPIVEGVRAGTLHIQTIVVESLNHNLYITRPLEPTSHQTFADQTPETVEEDASGRLTYAGPPRISPSRSFP